MFIRVCAAYSYKTFQLNICSFLFAQIFVAFSSYSHISQWAHSASTNFFLFFFFKQDATYKGYKDTFYAYICTQ